MKLGTRPWDVAGALPTGRMTSDDAPHTGFRCSGAQARIAAEA